MWGVTGRILEASLPWSGPGGDGDGGLAGAAGLGARGDRQRDRTVVRPRSEDRADVADAREVRPAAGGGRSSRGSDPIGCGCASLTGDRVQCAGADPRVARAGLRGLRDHRAAGRPTTPRRGRTEHSHRPVRRCSS